MTDNSTPNVTYRSDYQPPAYNIDNVDLIFELGEEFTTVKSRINFYRQQDDTTPLVLAGENLQLRSIILDGNVLDSDAYQVTETELTIADVPERFQLEIEVAIQPQLNMALSGLYKTSGNFCTQCEAEGFRRITYFLDRPDVMTRFSTTIIADKTQYPVLLSNGNRVEAGEFEDNRHWVRWDDPFLKPSYLFALVAGNLHCHAGEFVTCSGRTVRLEIWVEPQNSDKCEHALRSLQKSMQWDEEQFGREYDLDIYMIVAVNDFNMGAMENKGLNVFNSKYVLARTDTATDEDYEDIEAVIAHEYFHNWTGNRVTCRDWFQLTLKEGLTVFRDEQFTADMTSKAVKRIKDVKLLRKAQFPEDSGPMSHPIRPDSYIEMNNFYTATVYNKGAEVIRMYHTLLGADGFRKGMDLYFERHDGQAVTCDDFRAAMADANDTDLTQFERWYDQSGTPHIDVEEQYDADRQTYTLVLSQRAPDNNPDTQPFHIPVAMGLVGNQGEVLPLGLSTDIKSFTGSTRVLELTQTKQSFQFINIPYRPVLSLFRHYSAPVHYHVDYSSEDLAFLMAYDQDEFNRWDAGQRFMQTVILQIAEAIHTGEEPQLDPLLIDSFAKVLSDTELDGSIKALTLTLPEAAVLIQAMSPLDVDALHAAYRFVRRTLATRFEAKLVDMYQQLATAQGAYHVDKESIAARDLKNCLLNYISYLDTEGAAELLMQQFEAADNMTDAQAALVGLVEVSAPQRNVALAHFYQQWQHDPLVIDKWFKVQAESDHPDMFDTILVLEKHDAFTLKNPNRARALLGSLCLRNPFQFHQANGDGYRFLADSVLELNSFNPQIAARLVSAFNQWRLFDTPRQQLMQAQLERIFAHKELSKDVYEIVKRALEAPQR